MKTASKIKTILGQLIAENKLYLYEKSEEEDSNEKLLQDISISLKNQQKIDVLAGGVVSDVCSLNLDDFSVVIKYTKNHDPNFDFSQSPFHYRDSKRLLEPAPNTHQLDANLLRILQNKKNLKVPQVIAVNHEHRVTLMHDFRAQNFTMLQNLLVQNKISPKMGIHIGKNLAILVKEISALSTHEKIKPVEEAILQIEERFEELVATVGYDQKSKNRIHLMITAMLNSETLVATDTHPKNIAYNQKTNQVMFYDFGRTIYGDSQFTAPNFAAHVGLAILGGSIDTTSGIKFLSNFIQSYNDQAQKLVEVRQINETKFVEYFVGEMLHRGSGGRWIDQRIFQKTNNITRDEISDSIKKALQELALFTFTTDRKKLSISGLLKNLSNLRENIIQGNYLAVTKFTA